MDEHSKLDPSSYWRLKRVAKKDRKRELAASRALEKEKNWEALSHEEKNSRIQQFQARRALEAENIARNATETEKNIRGGWALHLVVDLDFDGLMTDSELKSVAQQLSYVFSICRRTNFRLWPSFVGVDERSSLKPYLSKRNLQCQKWPFYVGSRALNDVYGQVLSRLIYLSPDSHYVLTDIMSGTVQYSPKRKMEKSFQLGSLTDETTYCIEYDPSCGEKDQLGGENNITVSSYPHLSENMSQNPKTAPIYVIGGFIDKNRYKSLTLQKAIHLGISHARLPFDLYEDLSPLYAVLTINHVVQIFEHVVYGGLSLVDAMRAVTPKRRSG
ncbi:tRNA (guanine-N(1)-)-methyltransferase [Perkinsela sp. CCAP 1560/4]|nr:tRNA (guanine-N(1)-)-methyltransferase [Perkinsela sp. CCAP 1560/4]|eukprot:KNH08472.1 tRNA (guanine-N(1)-)-methyltransferase [Perkinsela sp. CCAP 1560/4]